MQRLFSTFANGWPGAGLLFQRGLGGGLLVYYGIFHALKRPEEISTIPEVTGAVAGLFLVVGLWTPIVGIVAAAAELWVILAGRYEPVIALMLGTLSATIAMIGPGAWSIDARIFGRKHIETPKSPKGRSAPLY